MPTPAERLALAADNIHAADHSSAGSHALDRNTEVEVSRRLAYAQAEALVAIGELLGQMLERTATVVDLADHGPPYVTKTGKLLTREEIDQLAEEAIAGYDVSHLAGQPSWRAAHMAEPPPGIVDPRTEEGRITQDEQDHLRIIKARAILAGDRADVEPAVVIRALRQVLSDDPPHRGR